MKGIGTDIVSINRIKTVYEKQGERFMNRVLTKDEQALFVKRKYSMSFLANRFAAKEAIAKALGTGIAKGVNFVDIEILPDDLGSPIAALSNVAQERLLNIGASTVHISISDEVNYAVAFAVLE